MFKIGDFSRMSRVSVKALRHYDDVGLLEPAHVDEESGYRYYTAEQLALLNRILALKDLGFSLEQIARLLKEGLSPAEMRGMLRLRQQEIQQRMEEEQGRLERVEARLRQIEQESGASPYDVIVKQTDARLIAGLRATIPDFPHIQALFAEMYTDLHRLGIRTRGPHIVFWHDREYCETAIDVEVAAAIEPCPIARFEPSLRVRPRELAEETVLSVVHQGEYGGIEHAYTPLLEYIANHRYQVAGAFRVLVLKWDFNMPPEQIVSEIQVPVELPSTNV